MYDSLELEQQHIAVSILYSIWTNRAGSVQCAARFNRFNIMKSLSFPWESLQHTVTRLRKAEHEKVQEEDSNGTCVRKCARGLPATRSPRHTYEGASSGCY